jgi:hypothetical protein
VLFAGAAAINAGGNASTIEVEHGESSAEKNAK